MTLLEKLKLIERVDQLIRMKATGSARDLANRIGSSERHVFKLVDLMKEMGAPVKYCRRTRSYIYEYEVSFSIGFIKGHKVSGGKGFNVLLHDSCSVQNYLDWANVS